MEKVQAFCLLFRYGNERPAPRTLQRQQGIDLSASEETTTNHDPDNSCNSQKDPKQVRKDAPLLPDYTNSSPRFSKRGAKPAKLAWGEFPADRLRAPVTRDQ
ncbi:hypothetical protein [Sunxiuqinia sp. sy24]|uniref:hypothetical protein n=1 Tax=Sunxiuqinia sp. sy24 TaxID=3461495 RepID=UPI004045626A